MKLLATLALSLAGATVLAVSYPDGEAAQHAGETAEVHGKVSDVYEAASGTLLINLGGKYPAQTFTAVVFSKRRAQFPDPKKLIGATVSVQGTIRLHKDKPEIVLETPSQLKVLATAPAAPAPTAAEPSAGTVVGPDGVTRRILP